MSEFREIPVLGGTNLRRGGSTKHAPDRDNVIGEPFGVTAGKYPALVQCAGERVDEHGDANVWWVLIETPHGRGWINGVRVDEGGDDQSFHDVTKAATVFDADIPHGIHQRITIVKGGATLRSGGSTNDDPDNAIGSVEGEIDFPALVQCTCEEVEIAPAKSAWWVLIDTPDGVGWVSAVRIEGGGNGKPIPDVPIAPTVFSTPPDLLP